MALGWIRDGFAPIKRILPAWLSNPIRSVATAVFTPLLFSYRTGHFRSSFRRMAVSAGGEPLPWYTYPAIDFLRFRDYSQRTVLEFGGGQSTLWWAKRAKRVVTCEGDRDWYEKIRHGMPPNVELHHVTMQDPASCVAAVERVLAASAAGAFDVVVIDGLYRFEMIEIARKHVAPTGLIVVDDAEGYGFFEGFKGSGLGRVDFYGHAPGVVLPRATAIYFARDSFAFDASNPIPVIADADA